MVLWWFCGGFVFSLLPPYRVALQKYHRRDFPPTLKKAILIIKEHLEGFPPKPPKKSRTVTKKYKKAENLPSRSSVAMADHQKRLKEETKHIYINHGVLWKNGGKVEADLSTNKTGTRAIFIKKYGRKSGGCFYFISKK